MALCVMVLIASDSMPVSPVNCHGESDMSNHTGTGRLDEQQVCLGVGRRNFLKLTGAGVAAGVMSAIDTPVLATQTLAWDKTFPKSERVDHRKVTFYNRLGITLVADLYVPKTIDRTQRHPSLVVGGPYGAVKEQASGLYAQTMAERGYITIAHDPSYVGESGGQPHGIASAEALVEDFSAGVDYSGRAIVRGPRADWCDRGVRQWRFRSGGS
jgi:hypothetical protein